MTAKYRLRYFYDWGCPVLWAANDAARDAYGYPADLDSLPLTFETIKRANELSAWHDTALNEDYPPDPGPWTADECKRFNQAAHDLLATLRAELGDDFEIVDEFTPESLGQ